MSRSTATVIGTPTDKKGEGGTAYAVGLVSYNKLGSILACSFAIGSVAFSGNCIKCGTKGGVSYSAGGLVGTNDGGRHRLGVGVQRRRISGIQQ